MVFNQPEDTGCQDESEAFTSNLLAPFRDDWSWPGLCDLNEPLQNTLYTQNTEFNTLGDDSTENDYWGVCGSDSFPDNTWSIELAESSLISAPEDFSSPREGIYPAPTMQDAEVLRQSERGDALICSPEITVDPRDIEMICSSIFEPGHNSRISQNTGTTTDISQSSLLDQHDNASGIVTQDTELAYVSFDSMSQSDMQNIDFEALFRQFDNFMEGLDTGQATSDAHASTSAIVSRENLNGLPELGAESQSRGSSCQIGQESVGCVSSTETAECVEDIVSSSATPKKKRKLEDQPVFKDGIHIFHVEQKERRGTTAKKGRAKHILESRFEGQVDLASCQSSFRCTPKASHKGPISELEKENRRAMKGNACLSCKTRGIKCDMSRACRPCQKMVSEVSKQLQSTGSEYHWPKIDICVRPNFDTTSNPYFKALSSLYLAGIYTLSELEADRASGTLVDYICAMNFQKDIVLIAQAVPCLLKLVGKLGIKVLAWIRGRGRSQNCNTSKDEIERDFSSVYYLLSVLCREGVYLAWWCRNRWTFEFRSSEITEKEVPFADLPTVKNFLQETLHRLAEVEVLENLYYEKLDSDNPQPRDSVRGCIRGVIWAFTGATAPKTRTIKHDNSSSWAQGSEMPNNSTSQLQAYCDLCIAMRELSIKLTGERPPELDKWIEVKELLA
ncbi:hypothetical protein TWF730_008341 [Orbilia blumenaviensis]|uniref:Zn(2)-C6 fungal-type domain-containing protein n=1 Tax=Orbilia blumenaviensis TaxID=1796055 RepID=A0AAV9V4D7_9PEZI